jgi:hypothetical protein
MFLTRGSSSSSKVPARFQSKSVYPPSETVVRGKMRANDENRKSENDQKKNGESSTKDTHTQKRQQELLEVRRRKY